MAIVIGKVEECNLEINKWGGLDWTVTLYEEDEDGVETVRNLTGYTPKAEIRQQYDDVAALVANFASIESGEATLGKIRLKMTHNVTAALSFDNAYWDLILEKTGVIREKVMRGIVTLKQGVTR